MRTIVVILIVLFTASIAALAELGQDKSDSRCERTNKTNTKMGGGCGFVCKVSPKQLSGPVFPRALDTLARSTKKVASQTFAMIFQIGPKANPIPPVHDAIGAVRFIECRDSEETNSRYSFDQ